MSRSLALRALCGQLIVGGFEGSAEPSETFVKSLAAGERGGAILFRANLDGGPRAVAALNRRLANASPQDLPLLLGVDQEGGRVARLGAPLLTLPPMRTLGDRGDALLVEAVAQAQGEELRALGFTMNFAPVLDVDSQPDNPIIGDRAFGSDPAHVARQALAFARGLARSGLLACGKHYPGHGDTLKDSHLDLPVVSRSRAELLAVELVPFRAAAQASIDALMTAHVIYPSLDPHVPATLSRAIATSLLRGALGFRGVLVSDDLEMRAVADRMSIEDAAIGSVAAGCDVLLVCHSEALQARAHEALVHEAETSSAFRARCSEAFQRGLAMRRRAAPHPAPGDDPLAETRARSQAVAARLSAKGPLG